MTDQEIIEHNQEEYRKAEEKFFKSFEQDNDILSFPGEFEPSGELSEILSKCQSECEFKSVIAVEYTPQEQIIIDILERYKDRDGVSTISRNGLLAYIHDISFKEFMKNLDITFFKDSTVVPRKQRSNPDFMEFDATKEYVRIGDKTFEIRGLR